MLHRKGISIFQILTIKRAILAMYHAKYHGQNMISDEKLYFDR